MGAVLDGWLFPLRDEEQAPGVHQPVLFVNTGLGTFINEVMQAGGWIGDFCDHITQELSEMDIFIGG